MSQTQSKQQVSGTEKKLHQRDLAGGSYKWWPPTGDHKFLYHANPVRFDFFDRYVEDWSQIHVLDVGSGGGYACEYLAKKGAVVCGTDILPDAIEEAQRHALQEGLEIQYSACTTTQLPYPDNSFDVITSFDVIEHIIDKEITLREIHRVLKPGGWFFFDTLSKTLTARLLVIWLGEVVLRLIRRGTHDWRYFIRPDDLCSLMKEIGFGQVDLAGLSLRWKWPGHALPLKVSRPGNQAVMYFGAAQKPEQQEPHSSKGIEG